MNINNGKDIDSLLFTHKGTNVKFKCTKRVENHYFDTFYEEAKVGIAFDDMKEVDYLIEMLERFKEAVSQNVGTWNVYRYVSKHEVQKL